MTRSLILKALPIVIAVVLLQLAFATDSQAQGGYGDGGYGGGGYGGGGYGGGGYGGGGYGGGGYGGGGYGGGGYGGSFYYTVQYGDTLFAICRRFGVDPYHIAQVNGLPNPNHIYAGQVLYIPPSSGYCPGVSIINLAHNLAIGSKVAVTTATNRAMRSRVVVITAINRAMGSRVAVTIATNRAIGKVVVTTAISKGLAMITPAITTITIQATRRATTQITSVIATPAAIITTATKGLYIHAGQRLYMPGRLN